MMDFGSVMGWLRLKPAASNALYGMPAAGTSRDSMPAGVPA